MIKRKTALLTTGLTSAILIGVSNPAISGGTIQIGENQHISIGAGIRSSFSAVENGAPDGDAYGSDFAINNMRLYISGQIAKDWKFTVNTDEIWGEMGVLDAIIQYEPSPYFNVWFGRLLTPADRIEMNGPYYAINWNQYTVPLYPSDNDAEKPYSAGVYGRDDGMVIWGSADKFQYAVGAFNGLRSDANKSSSLLYSMRLAYNFLNKEDNPGYYTSGTYYGAAGDIFTIGLSAQMQKNGSGSDATDAEDFSGYAVDMLFEKVLSNGSVVTIDGEYKSFSNDASSGFQLFNGESMFVTAAYLLPGQYGQGRVQPYARITSTSPENGSKSDLNEFGINYIIQGHNLKLNANMTDGDANPSGASGDSVKTFTVGFQYQI